MLVSFCVLWSVLVFEVDSTEMSVFQFTDVHRLHDWQVRVSRSDIDVFFSPHITELSTIGFTNTQWNNEKLSLIQLILLVLLIVNYTMFSSTTDKI